VPCTDVSSCLLQGAEPLPSVPGVIASPVVARSTRERTRIRTTVLEVSNVQVIFF